VILKDIYTLIFPTWERVHEVVPLIYEAITHWHTII